MEIKSGDGDAIERSGKAAAAQVRGRGAHHQGDPGGEVISNGDRRFWLVAAIARSPIPAHDAGGHLDWSRIPAYTIAFQ